jgi:hypothetical protein
MQIFFQHLIHVKLFINSYHSTYEENSNDIYTRIQWIQGYHSLIQLVNFALFQGRAPILRKMHQLAWTSLSVAEQKFMHKPEEG